MDRYNTWLDWLIAIVVSILATITLTFVVWVYFNRDEAPVRECERLLVATPVEDDKVTVVEMRVCGRDLEWFRISPNDTTDLV